MATPKTTRLEIEGKVEELKRITGNDWAVLEFTSGKRGQLIDLFHNQNGVIEVRSLKQMSEILDGLLTAARDVEERTKNVAARLIQNAVLLAVNKELFWIDDATATDTKDPEVRRRVVTEVLEGVYGKTVPTDIIDGYLALLGDAVPERCPRCHGDGGWEWEEVPEIDDWSVRCEICGHHYRPEQRP